MCKYSVIVPVYKVEAVLPRCIDSILNQTVTDFELILIDDGSPDSSGAICNEYAAKDARVRVIHQENGGVSKARNAGLDAAQGEYIVFVDSDDYVDETYLQRFDENPADLVMSGYEFEKYHAETLYIKRYEGEYISNLSRMEFIRLFEQWMLNFIWGKCLRSSVISAYHIRFDEEIHLAEDTLFSVQYALHCQSVRVLAATEYHYLTYPHETLSGSTMSINTVYKLEKANNRIYHVLKEYLGDQTERVVAARIAPTYRYIFIECINGRYGTFGFIYKLFKQKWMRYILNDADKFYKDEHPKYQALLKTKSPTLFFLYCVYVRMHNR